jgi:hypothetical protein
MPICCEILCCNFDAGQTRLKRKSQKKEEAKKKKLKKRRMEVKKRKNRGWKSLQLCKFYLNHQKLYNI